MGIIFHPPAGMLLICDFDTGFQPPEMVKCRPVVTLRKAHAGLVVVVPLSKTQPDPLEEWHYEMSLGSLPSSLQARCWAKCDMICAVGLKRLDRIKNGTCKKTGKPLFVAPQVLAADFAAIQQGVRAYLRL